MIIISSLIVLLGLITFIVLQHPQFGKAPSGDRLERIKQSPNFKDGKFQNISITPGISEGYSMISLMYDFLFRKFPRTIPSDSLPSIKSDLKNIPISENVFVWFGHSSYYIQLEGQRFLVDPVFSGNASPVPSSNKSFLGSDIYTVEDLPEIDYLLITHDHYDHLDYETIVKLKPKIKQIICGLGVGSHFEHWKFDSSIITEKDWNEKLRINDSLTIHTTSARHFSGRTFTRNNTLWLSFVIETPHLKIFLGGDSGYDTHFREIGEKFGGFDLVILENGQYNTAWHEIHLLPEEALKAAEDLQAKRLIPVHNSKFKLGFHPWDEPLNQLTELNKDRLPIITPKIGEIFYLNVSTQQFDDWWRGIQ